MRVKARTSLEQFQDSCPGNPGVVKHAGPELLLDAGTGWRSRDGGSLDDFRAFLGALPQR